MSATPLHWTLWTWDDWPRRLIHDAFQLRSAVFVVEQACIFLELDGLDPYCQHLCGCDDDGRLLAYSRLLAPGVKYPEASIGRVITAGEARGRQLGRALMRESLAAIRRLHPAAPIRIGAQARLQGFYESFGFVAIGDAYLEDDILHIDMLLPATAPH